MARAEGVTLKLVVVVVIIKSDNIIKGSVPYCALLANIISEDLTHQDGQPKTTISTGCASLKMQGARTIANTICEVSHRRLANTKAMRILCVKLRKPSGINRTELIES